MTNIVLRLWDDDFEDIVHLVRCTLEMDPMEALMFIQQDSVLFDYLAGQVLKTAGAQVFTGWTELNSVESWEDDPLVAAHTPGDGVLMKPVVRLDGIIQSMRATVRKVASQHASGDKTGRNAPCPCGSGKKYKNCCLP